MQSALRAIGAWLAFPGRYFFWGSLGIVLFSAWVIGTQVGDRWGFANSALYQDVLDRWGAPIVQPAPSARFVESGSVFNTLGALPFDSQKVRVHAAMNYRRRGLVYFSGFEFDFEGAYALTNPEAHAIDVAFVFPIHAQRNRILLSDLRFAVDGKAAAIPLDEESDKLVWTGRLEPGQTARFDLGFRGRGLDGLTYRLDPSLPVRDFELDLRIVGGGDEIDYAQGVLPSHRVEATADGVDLHWGFPSLESGVPVGVILPSEESYDAIITTMVWRSPGTFALFFGALTVLAAWRRRPLERYEAYLVASGYAFFFVLLPYLAAYMDFHVAYGLACGLIGALLVAFLTKILSPDARRALVGLVFALLVVPTAAVILQRHTGLIYSIEILFGLGFAMWLATRAELREVLRGFERRLSPNPTLPPDSEETSDAPA